MKKKANRVPKKATKKEPPTFWPGSSQVLGNYDQFVLLTDGNGKVWRVSISDGYAYEIDWR